MVRGQWVEGITGTTKKGHMDKTKEEGGSRGGRWGWLGWGGRGGKGRQLYLNNDKKI